ncbi:MAG: F0F1 ATP synthase subunit epsilon [Chloroflexota bacterium]|nr:F0F1 ATP synthase subunit epsilon [Dehalococcoidia bacterium]MDW8254314.1 F0F1 ATP synthase subunit epsilon [Chloroflexota bacterium]
MPLKFEIVTAERQVYADEVDLVVAPGSEGALGILPRHTPLVTRLVPGELLVRRGEEEVSLFVSGGFIEVLPDKVVVLADTAERVEEIDVARAEEARRRAQERLRERPRDLDVARAELALQRSLARLRLAEKRRKRDARPQV